MVNHIKCDIFKSGVNIILHQVNCQGVMGSGIAKQVKEKYPLVFEAYKALCDIKEDKAELLGTAQIVRVGENMHVVNLFAQERYGYRGCFTDYNALRECLEDVNDHFDNEVIAIPYLMGCCRGSGDWNIVYKMIEETFTKNDVLICEYDGG